MADKTEKATPAKAPTAPATGAAATGRSGGEAKVIWDDSQMRTTFANVVNGASTREEVTLFFGTNQSWNMGQGSDVKVQLSDRIVLTPYASKRLLVLLDAIVKSYENAHGTLNIEPGGN